MPSNAKLQNKYILIIIIYKIKNLKFSNRDRSNLFQIDNQDEKDKKGRRILLILTYFLPSPQKNIS